MEHRAFPDSKIKSHVLVFVRRAGPYDEFDVTNSTFFTTPASYLRNISDLETMPCDRIIVELSEFIENIYECFCLIGISVKIHHDVVPIFVANQFR